MKTVFEETWKNWIKTNVDNGQDKNGIFKILLDEGYTYGAIAKEMQFEPDIPVNRLKNPFDAERKAQTRRAKVNYGQPIDRHNIFIPNANVLDTDKLEMYTLEHFLNPEECQKLIQLIRSKLRPSGLSSYEEDNTFRTSQTCILAAINDPFVKEIDHRICQTMGIDSSYSESIQGQHYEIGQEFKAHTDFFEPHEIEEHGGKMGQRTYTFMIYLNDTPEGGETEFLNINTKFSPKAGTAIIWNSLDSHGVTNSHSLHHAHPVLQGNKTIITKWFRSKSNQPSPPPMFCKAENEYVQNYTKTGFLKSTMPERLFSRISEFYHKNKSQQADEHVEGGFIFDKNNGKKVSSQLVQLPLELREDIHDQMKPMMSQWCGKELAPTYVYGIRVYKHNAVLKSHRDRLETHIISAILNVDQEVNEDWPLVIEDNYYRTHHILLKPGEMIFYEGARLIHGRPIALNGKSFANIFCHFKPTDYIPRKIR